MAEYTNKSKLYVIITDERGQASSGGSTETAATRRSKKFENPIYDASQGNTFDRYAEHEMFHFVKSTVTETINYSLSNIGNFTGDYITQRNVNVGKQFISGIMSVALTTYAGFRSGAGVVGGAVGFVIGAASLVVQEVETRNLSYVENAKANYDINQLSKRVGLNSLRDGSRGTEN